MGLAVTAGLAWYLALDLQALETLAADIVGASASVRVKALFERLAEQSWWAYFTDPYFLMSTGFIALGLLLDVGGHAWKEKSWPKGWRASAFYRLAVKRSLCARTDLILFIYNRLSLYLVVVPLFAIFGPVFVYFLLVKFINFDLLGFMEEGVPKLLIFLVVADFFQYLNHYVLHKNKALWEIHKFHHSTTEMNIITGTRDHPFEKAILKVFSAIPLAILGAPTEQYFLIIVIQHALGIFIHSDWNISYGWFDKILISPHMHRIHHSVTQEHWDTNYGVIFSVWDRMFGTLYTGDNPEPKIDVTGNYFNQKGFWYDLVAPMILCFRRAWNALPGRQSAVDDEVLARQVA